MAAASQDLITLHVIVFSATNLHNCRLIGKQSPYVKIFVDGKPFDKTTARSKAGTDAVWGSGRGTTRTGEKVPAGVSTVRFEVWAETTFSEEMLGAADVQIADVRGKGLQEVALVRQEKPAGTIEFQIKYFTDEDLRQAQEMDE